jgi:dTDP-4-dehydrorhamnose reductase
MRVLVLGGTGQVGEELLSLAPRCAIDVFAPDRTALELLDGLGLARMVWARPWDVVINAAAFTEVDRAESEEAAAFALNAEVPASLAAETARRGVPLIHISTDYVFDGHKGTPYLEEDGAAPVNAYGRSKLAGEQAVAAMNVRHVILRTAWLHSPYRKNFVKTLLRLAAERERLTVVADQYGCPTAARDVAQACLDIARRCAMEPGRAPYGTYHLAGCGEASWFEFARTIFDMAADRLGRTPNVVPIRTSEYPTAAARPADTRLDCTAVARAFGIAPRPWREALAETIDRLLGVIC